jgi:hypothetical protein
MQMSQAFCCNRVKTVLLEIYRIGHERLELSELTSQRLHIVEIIMY